MDRGEKETVMGIIGAILSIPMAFAIHYMGVNAGWAFILGIAYAGIWRTTNQG